MDYTMDEDSIPAIRGWVTKQGGSHKSWKKRWFQTTPRNPFRLDYYTNDSCSTLKGHIDMSGVTDMITTRNKDKDGNLRYGFQLVTEKRTWKLIVEGEEDGEYWRESFRKLINQVRKSKGLPPLERKKHKRHHKKDEKKKKHRKEKKEKKEEEKSNPPPPPTTTHVAPPPPATFTPAAPPPRVSNVNIAVAAPPPKINVAVVAAAPPPSSMTQQQNKSPRVQVSPRTEETPRGNESEEEYDDDEEYEYDDDEGDDISESEIFDTEIRPCEPPEKYAVALHQYDSTTETELSIQRGQKLIIFDDSDPEGWLGAETVNGTRGWVSAHFVKFL